MSPPVVPGEHNVVCRLACEHDPDRVAQVAGRDADVQVEEVLPEHLVLARAPHLGRRAAPGEDAQTAVDDDDALLDAREDR